MQLSNTFRVPTRFAICFVAAATALGAALVGCEDSDVDINGLTTEPETINKGETVLVSGTVDTLAELTSVSVTLLDDKDAPLPEGSGLTVQSNGLQKNKISWNLRSDGDVKVVTTSAAKSGKYQVRVEGKTEQKNAIDKATFTIR
jgi:hypothetical protein